MSNSGNKKIGLISLGCPKNRVDSEVMLGCLVDQGYEITTSEQDADILVVNTCGFIEPAKEESIRTILEMAQKKKEGSCSKLIVTGCLVQRYRDEMKAEFPEVDAFLGVNELEQIVQIADPPQAPEEPAGPSHRSDLYLYNDRTPRVLSTPGHFAYVKIAEGCDHTCAFCIIPAIRGLHRSRPIESIVQEARQLAKRGVRELNLVSQDTTRYGKDLGQRHGLARLLEALARVDGIEWLRVHYTYPNSLDPAFIDVMASEPKVCPYLDMPFQHASSSILAAMRRGGNRGMLEELLQRVRDRVPEVAVRTTLIVGFPGETDGDFEELLDFCQQARFDHLGVFTYFDEEGTGAFELQPKVPERIKTERRRRLMQQQARLSRSWNRHWVGRTLRVLVEGPSAESEYILQGRTARQAPEIDGTVLITDCGDSTVPAGEFRDVYITDCMEYDLIGSIVPPSESCIGAAN